MAGQGRHVLTVEDEQDERYALRALLEVWGHRVEEAENGVRGSSCRSTATRNVA